MELSFPMMDPWLTGIFYLYLYQKNQPNGVVIVFVVVIFEGLYYSEVNLEFHFGHVEGNFTKSTSFLSMEFESSQIGDY